MEPVKISQDEKLLPRKIRLRIKNIYHGLNKAERKAVDYIVSKTGSISNLRIEDVARDAFCSEATVFRVMRLLGFAGYKEFKNYLFDYFSGKIDDPLTLYHNLHRSDDVGSVVKKVFESTIDALQDTLSVINFDQFTRAARSLSEAQRIIFLGVGDAQVVASAAAIKFERIGYTCSAPTDLDRQIIASSQVSRKDVVFAISHSGRSRSIYRPFLEAKRRGATTICITNFAKSPIAKQADFKLITSCFDIYSTTSEVVAKRVTGLCLIESLYIYITLNSNSPVVEIIEEAEELIMENQI